MLANNNDLLATDKSRYFAQPHPIIVNFFFTIRSLFDIHRNLKDSTQKPAQQVFVSCNFCGNNILTNILSTGQ